MSTVYCCKQEYGTLTIETFGIAKRYSTINLSGILVALEETSKEPVCPRVELIFKIIIILLIIFLGFIKSKPC